MRSCTCFFNDGALRAPPRGDAGALSAGRALTSMVLPSAVTEMPLRFADAAALVDTLGIHPAAVESAGATYWLECTEPESMLAVRWKPPTRALHLQPRAFVT